MASDSLTVYQQAGPWAAQASPALSILWGTFWNVYQSFPSSIASLGVHAQWCKAEAVPTEAKVQ